MAAELEDVKSNIRSVLVASLKEGVRASRFASEYTSLTSENLEPQKLGFRNVNDLMCAIPDTVRVAQVGGEAFFFAVVNAETAGVASLVARQKGKKKRGAMAAKYKGVKLSGRSSGPSYHDFRHSVPTFKRPAPPIVRQQKPVVRQPNFYQRAPPELMGLNTRPASQVYSSYPQAGNVETFKKYEAPIVSLGLDLNEQYRVPSSSNAAQSGFSDHLYDFERVLTEDEASGTDSYKSDDDGQSLEEDKSWKSDTSNCQKFFELPAQPDVKKMVSNKVEAYFTYSYSPKKFFVHLQCEDQVQMIMDNCNTASESMPDLPNSVIEMGLLILYKCKFDGAWCRGQIVPNDYVLLVDFGSKEPFTRMRAKLIPESLVQFPALARQCCLTGVKPSANVWSKNAKKFFQDNCEDVELSLKIVDLLYASPDQKNPNLEVDVFLRSGLNVADELVKEGHAIRVEPSALSPGLPTSQVSPVENQVSSWMEKVVERSSPHKPSQQSSVSGVSENVPNELKLNPDTLVQQYPKVDSPHAVPLDEEVQWEDFVIVSPESGDDPKECVLSHVDEEGNVFLQFPDTDGFQRLLGLLRKVNTAKDKNKFHNFVSIPEENKLYIVYEKSLQLFLRGEVRKVHRDTVDVNFVDYGFTKNVSRDSFRVPDPYNPTFEKLPPQCKRFCLACGEYNREIHEDYLFYIIENGRRLKCWMIDSEKSSIVLQFVENERFVYDVLDELNELASFDEPCNIYREYSSLIELEDMNKMFLTSHGRFSRLLPVDEVQHDQLVSFYVIAIWGGHYMKVVSSANYSKYKDLKLCLEFECRDRKESAPLSSLKTGAYFLVRSPLGPSGTDEDCPAEVMNGERVPDDQAYSYHRCKLADHTHNFFFALFDIDTGEFLFSHRSNIFTLPKMLYSPQYPIVSWNASFLFHEDDLPVDLVGKQYSCRAIYPDRSSLQFHKPVDGF